MHESRRLGNAGASKCHRCPDVCCDICEPVGCCPLVNGSHGNEDGEDGGLSRSLAMQEEMRRLTRVSPIRSQPQRPVPPLAPPLAPAVAAVAPAPGQNAVPAATV